MHMPKRLNYKPFKSAGYSFLFHCLATNFCIVYKNIKAMVLSLDTELLNNNWG